MDQNRGQSARSRNRWKGGAVGLLLGAAWMALSACEPTHNECNRSADCGSGESCIWMRNETDTGRHTVCRVLCIEASQCAAESYCACPDSPLGGRCHLTDGAPLSYPDGGVAPVFYCSRPESDFP